MEIVINKLINQFTKGVSRYTHGDSTWLIFSESKQWVVELTGSKTLWYNYNFFQEIFHYASLDVVQNQHLITKWVEDNIINETKRTNGRGRVFRRRKEVESVIANGVKETNGALRRTLLGVDDIIQNGVKETKVEKRPGIKDTKIEDTIENGVKITSSLQSREYTGDIDEALQKGVKRTIWANYTDPDRIDEVVDGVEETNWANHADPDRIDEVIDNGIKETKKLNESVINWIDDIIGKDVEEVKPRQDAVTKSEKRYLNNIIENGIKETSHRQFLKTYDVKDTIQDGTEHDRWILDGCDDPVDEVIDNGIKETNYDTSKYIEDVNEVIENGIEEIYEVDWDVPNDVIDDVVDNGVKNSNPRQYVGESLIDRIIDKGIIETHDDIYHHRGRVDGVIKNGIKETKTPGDDGDIIGVMNWMLENKTNNVPKMIDDIIKNGIKETEPMDDWVNTVRIVTEVIDEGIKKPTD